MPVRGIFRRKGEAIWSFDIVISGNRFCGSTSCTEKRAAEKWITTFRAERRAALAQLSGNEPMTFGAASTRWWIERGQHRQDSDCLEAYLALLQKRIGMKALLATIDDNEIAKLVTLRRADGVSNSTVNRSCTEPLRAILLRAKKTWKQTIQEIAWRDHILDEPEGIVRELSRTDEATAFAALRIELHPIAKFLLIVGWRRSEACFLKATDINFETGFASVIGKGGKVLRRPLPAAAIAILRAEIGKHPEWVFSYVPRRSHAPTGIKKGVRTFITPGMLTGAWIRMRNSVGLPKQRLHDLRHTMASRVLRVSGNLMAVSKGLGHSKISTTQRYAQLQAEDVRAALDAASPVANISAAANPAESPVTAPMLSRKAK